MNKQIITRRACIVFVAVLFGFICERIYSRFVFGDEERTLHVYNWSDYIAPEVIEEFEKQNGCKVCIDTFDDNETMLAKIQAGATGYDIIFPSSYIIPVLKKNGMIRELDIDKLPNVSTNFDFKFNDALHLDTFKYSIPYAFSITGIAYRKDKVQLNDKEKNGDFSWNFLMNKSLAGKVCIMNDIREMLGIGLKMIGKSTNSTNENDIASACKSAISLKKIARRMDSVEYRVGLVDGSFYAAIAYSSDIFQIVQENPDVPISFVVPSEGSNSSWDEMCITSTSENVDLAHKFINYLYDAQVAAKNVEYVGSAFPNKGMMKYLHDEIRDNPMVNVPKSIIEKIELIQDVGESISTYNKYWDVFMSAH